MKKTQLRLFCALATLGILSTTAYGATPEGKTEAILVTADRAQEMAKQDSQQISIITAKDIAKKQAKSAEDVVFSETGVFRTVDAMGRVGVSIRGAEARHTLILVDGQPVLGEFAKYLGAGDELSRIGTENLARLEVTKGAGTSKYGSDAIGGVINVITKRPSQEASLQFNGEFRKIAGTGLTDNSNIYIRADSGQMGKVRLALYGSKRDLLPVYASEKRTTTALAHDDLSLFENNSLRYYGVAANVGVMGDINVNKKHSVSFKIDHYQDDLERYLKHSDSINEPQEHFIRKIDRNTYNLTWSGRNDTNTDWKVEFNYGRNKEKDITLGNDVGKTAYEGNNTLQYVDNVDHKQYTMQVTANTSLNDEHLLTYGFGISKETGEGSRLKSAPKTHTIDIDPWDYDKSLYVKRAGKPDSRVHDYKFYTDKKGVINWDNRFEWYGYDPSDKNTKMPAFTYEDYLEYIDFDNRLASIDNLTGDAKRRYDEFNDELVNIASEKDEYFFDEFFGTLPPNFKKYMVEEYYSGNKDVTYNDLQFRGAYELRNNKLTIGEASINRQHAFVQDTWQVNDNTVITPIIRLDYSNLFGSHMTFNVGATHNVKGNPNERLKANIGTGYAEPGMGELYYNWEMYGSHPVDGWLGGGVARLGWYWAGNPNLKPEKSLNFDISYEKDLKNTHYKVSLFHNRINDYMSVYYTGNLLDFNPELNENNALGGAKFTLAPDMIYSFKNIGRAEITGLETEVSHSFNDHWSAKLGYTYLHAVNKSDPTMPKQLLDKPKHKIDLALSYENKKSGWSGTLWTDYNIDMLDSNAASDKGNYMLSEVNGDGKSSHIEYTFNVGKPATYKKKSFGIWHIMVQKEFNKDAMAYVGIDNLFNHHDDDRALQGRQFRMGLNLRTAFDGDRKNLLGPAGTGGFLGLGSALDSFFDKPYLENFKEGEQVLYGAYVGRFNMNGGEDRPNVRETLTSSVGDGARNLLDGPERGLENRLILGAAGKMGAHTTYLVEGSLRAEKDIDTKYNVASSAGIKELRLDKAEVTHRAKAFDLSLGRLHETFGATGYYFGQTFDGGRLLWMGDKGQVAIGFGSFKDTTGIEDSPYLGAQYATFHRSPTTAEFIGLERFTYGQPARIIDPNKEKTTGFYKQLEEAGTDRAKQIEVVKKFLDFAKKAYPEILSNDSPYYPMSPVSVPFTYTKDGAEETGTVKISSYASSAVKKAINVAFTEKALVDADAFIDSWWMENKDTFVDAYTKEAQKVAAKKGGTFKALEANEIKEAFKKEHFTDANHYRLFKYKVYVGSSSYVNRLFDAIASEISGTEGGNTMPREALAKAIGSTIETEGVFLTRDSVPAVRKAFFVQGKYKLTPSVGLVAWTWQSMGDKRQTYLAANGMNNDEYGFDKVASVFGVGAKWQLGEKAAVSVDYGVNTSKLGKYLHGETVYDHKANSNDFMTKGRTMGSAPTFWTVRLDMGQMDTNKAGTWNAFIDYKHFEHGAFFGGNGTGFLPDRYLDGISSFTVGAGYVPRKDILVEAFYTFDAKGLGKRATLFGNETFHLGNYTRVQMTYKF